MPFFTMPKHNQKRAFMQFNQKELLFRLVYFGFALEDVKQAHFICKLCFVHVLKVVLPSIVEPQPQFSEGGVVTTPKQFLPRCSKTRSQGEKLLRVPLSSSFPLIKTKKNSNLPPPRGQGKLSKLGGRGVGAIP